MEELSDTHTDNYIHQLELLSDKKKICLKSMRDRNYKMMCVLVDTNAIIIAEII